ncbi:MAG TPA: recombination mediator RecR [Chiayiivirga sp.]|uniref:Recombination protein RecR n=1 Tax=Denitratimonas tolerans TaxID=1338420 RepID=A0AAW9R487_9GAMM|nr:recombination mediator RecR [Chiayiivirga sp.]HRN59894.1 recombination mediator RecR [Chiayiivirga sp.]HRO87569.1 recombination mediator RecR [Chiayiivirga sp.]HRQ34566.1 recombination mediator RecR [Chiayiivirga sp.]
MSSSRRLEELIEALRCLPGVGARTAQRMAHHLLERNRDGGRRLAQRLAEAMDGIGNCARCRNFSDTELCSVCTNASRDASLLCVVEMPADQVAIEQATGYRGRYFVLQGRLSPLDGLGPRELGLDLLTERLAEGEVRELIIATNPTVEGEATAHYLAQLARQHGVRPSRLAHGVPLGGELEYIDRGTLAHAFGARQDAG